MSAIEGSVVLITGAADGIGFAIANEFLRNRARGVTLVDVDQGKGNARLEQLGNEFGANKAIFVQADVSNYEQLEEAFKQTVAKFDNLDIVVNNAGVMSEKDGSWRKEISVNLNGTINGNLLAIEHYLPKYRTSKDSSLVLNISSIAGLDPCASFPVYAATKHAVLGLSRSFGAPHHFILTGIRVVTVCPGITDTYLSSNLGPKALGEKYSQLWDMESAKCITQSTEELAKEVMGVVEKANTCSVWMIEGGRTFEIDIPLRNQRVKL